MNGDPLNCPYCNAHQPYQPGLQAGSRVSCVRCGEAFVLTQTPEPPTGDLTARESVVVPAPPARSNALVAGLVLAVMGLMAGLGLTYALLTVSQRRDNDRALSKRPRSGRTFSVQEDNEADTRPTRLKALGYLPPETGIIAGLHLGELLTAPSAAALREQSIKIGTLDFSLAAVPTWSGLEADQVDHLVLGVVLREEPDRELTPPIHLVVHTRRPYDATRVRTALKASQPSQEATRDGQKRTVYQASLRNFPARLWLADERTLVLGLFTRLELLPSRPYATGDHLPAAVRTLLEERITPGAAAWLVGHSSDWKKTVIPLFVGNVPGIPLLGKLEQTRNVALSLLVGDRPRVQAAFQFHDADTAEKLTRSELAPLLESKPDRYKVSQQADWVDVQIALVDK